MLASQEGHVDIETSVFTLTLNNALGGRVRHQFPGQRIVATLCYPHNVMAMIVDIADGRPTFATPTLLVLELDYLPSKS
jgi:hypothetical protein